MTNISVPPIIVGITGNIGSGKSTVAHLWQRYNAIIIEGDVLGKNVVDESAEFRDWLRERFGSQIFDGDDLKRAELGRIVFSDQSARDDLNSAIWPYIRERLEAQIDQARVADQVAIVDAALIYEWNDSERYDVIVAVIADPHAASMRAAERLQLSQEEIMQRYRMQIPAQEKATRSDFVIRNDGDLNELRAKAFGIWPHVARRAKEAAKRRAKT